MTQTTSIFSQTEPAEERRRALAKVYAILIKLAEEAERGTAPSEALHVRAVTEDTAPVKDLVPA